jgi:hypothetical protein
LKPIRQHAKQEARDEFISIKRRGLCWLPSLQSFQPKRNLAALDIEHTIVGNGDAMCVSSEIFETSSGPAKARLA